MRRRDVDRILSLVKPRAGEWLYDLGCGDGRVLVRSAQRFGTRGIGFEISLLPYLCSQGRILLTGQWRTVAARFRNFYRQPLTGANIVTVFLMERALQKLAPKLVAELRPGSRVASYAFPIPGWQPAFVDKPTATSIAIYGYVMPPPAAPARNA